MPQADAGERDVVTSQRIAIIGNSGAGKSHLARALAQRLHLPVIDLDDIFWLDRSYTAKRSGQEIRAALDGIREQDRWIVEGVYGSMVERLLDRADTLIWLALSVSDCSQSLLEREAAQCPAPTPTQAKSFASLMAYATTYDQRTDDISRAGHQRLLEGFAGRKLVLRNRAEVDASIQGVASA